MTPHPRSIRPAVPVLAFLLAGVAGLAGEEHDALSGILERRIEDFSVQGQEAKVVLEGIGAGYRFPIVVEPDVQGTITIHADGRTAPVVVGSRQ